jgi:hypothetical protein
MYWVAPIAAVALQVCLIWHGVPWKGFASSAAVLVCVLVVLWFWKLAQMATIPTNAVPDGVMLVIELPPTVTSPVRAGLILTAATVGWASVWIFQTLKA